MANFSFHSLVPALKRESGHEYPYHNKVKEAVEALGGVFTGYANVKCSIEPLEPHWKKWFRRKKDITALNKHFFKYINDCKKIFRIEGATRRIMFLESFTTGDMLGLLISAYFFSRKNDSLWILFRFKRTKRIMKLQSFFMKCAKKLLKNKLVLLSDSTLLQEHLEKLFSQPLQLLPQYLSPLEYTPIAKPTSLENISLAWLGGPRAEKGLSLIDKLTKLQDAQSKNFKLTYSEAADFHTSSKLTLCPTKKNLDWNEYNIYFKQSDVMLLPYDPQQYSLRTSGIFIESILGGKVPLVRDNTWLAFELRSFALDDLIINWEDPHFFTTLHKLLQKDEIYEKLEQMQHHYRTLHCAESLKRDLAKYIA